MYEFYASVNNGPFQSLGQSAENSIKFMIPDSTKNNYRFYVLVTDNVGNAQKTVPEFAEVNTLLVNAEMNHNPGSVISVYPNPAKMNVTIEFMAKAESKFVLNIYSVNGILLKTLDEGWVNLGHHHIAADISFLNPGVYFVAALHDNKTEIIKLIKR
jgi:hypothetical protein